MPQVERKGPRWRTRPTWVGHPAGAALESAPGRAVAARRFRRCGGGPAGGGLSVDGLRLVERFTRTGPNSIDYEMTLSDPATYTRDWTIVLPMIANGGGMFEYACHEGNYGMEGILAGHRAEELRTSDA